MDRNFKDKSEQSERNNYRDMVTMVWLEFLCIPRNFCTLSGTQQL